MTASFVPGSSKSSTYPEGTPPVSIRLRPCWTAFLSILPMLSQWVVGQPVGISVNLQACVPSHLFRML